MNIGETRVRAPPATRREATVPTRQQSPPPPPEGTKSASDEIMVEMGDQEYCISGMEFRWERLVDSTRHSSSGENGTVPGQE